MKKIVFCLMLLCVMAKAGTNRLEKTILRERSNVREALALLNKTRAKIEKERRPLLQQYEDIYTKVKAKRRESERLNLGRAAREENLRKLDARLASLQEQCRFARGALREYRRNMGALTPQPLLALHKTELDRTDQLLRVGSLEETAELTETMLTFLAEIVGNLQGSCRISGVALNKAGVEVKGDYIFVGSIGYFFDGKTGGIVQRDSGHLLPSFYSQLPRGGAVSIADMFAGERVKVPIDVTGGDALLVASSTDSFVEGIKKGGVVMIPIVLIGVLSILLSVWKLFELRTTRAASSEEINAVTSELEKDAFESARAKAATLPPPVTSLLSVALEYRSAPREHTEEILHEHILAMLPKLERHSGTLAVMGGVAPLLGLLGTVTGMMHTFALITMFGSGQARLLSGGISEALITTKFGLAIAIPILLVHAFFARRVRMVVADLENNAVKFVNSIYR